MPITLAWQSDFFTDQDGKEVEVERPVRWPLGSGAAEAAALLNHTTWSDLNQALQSPLFRSPIEHFLVRAFLSEGIDEFLAHITVIEAGLGLSVDYNRSDRTKMPGKKNPGATVRVAARLSALLSTNEAGKQYQKLFELRSAFLHGRVMSPISSQDRVLARRLARETVVALIKAALQDAQHLSRDGYLDHLLAASFSFASPSLPAKS